MIIVLVERIRDLRKVNGKFLVNFDYLGIDGYENTHQRVNAYAILDTVEKLTEWLEKYLRDETQS